jgi:hypothetical protein
LERNVVVGVDFLIMGAIISAAGFVLAQSVPIASFGFALLVIGALVLLLVPEPVPQDAFRSMMKDAVRNVEVLLEESGLRNKGYFLKMADGEVRAFIPSSGKPEEKPDLSLIEKAPLRLAIDYKGLKGVLIIAPGNEIVKLAKVEQGADLEEALRTALVEYSDFASSVLAIEEGGLAKIQIKRPAIRSDSPYFNDALGTPVSCVAACAAAVAKGKPVRLVKEMFDPGLIRLTLETVGE